MVIQCRIRIPDHFSTFLTIAEYIGILRDLLVIFIQSAIRFHGTRRNGWLWQGKESATFWERWRQIQTRLRKIRIRKRIRMCDRAPASPASNYRQWRWVSRFSSSPPSPFPHHPNRFFFVKTIVSVQCCGPQRCRLHIRPTGTTFITK